MCKLLISMLLVLATGCASMIVGVADGVGRGADKAKPSYYEAKYPDGLTEEGRWYCDVMAPKIVSACKSERANPKHTDTPDLILSSHIVKEFGKRHSEANYERDGKYCYLGVKRTEISDEGITKMCLRDFESNPKNQPFSK